MIRNPPTDKEAVDAAWEALRADWESVRESWSHDLGKSAAEFFDAHGNERKVCLALSSHA